MLTFRSSRQSIVFEDAEDFSQNRLLKLASLRSFRHFEVSKSIVELFAPRKFKSRLVISCRLTDHAPPHSVCRNNRQKDSHLRVTLVKRRVEPADIGSRLARVIWYYRCQFIRANKRAPSHDTSSLRAPPPSRGLLLGCVQSSRWKALAISIPFRQLSLRCMTTSVTRMIWISELDDRKFSRDTP